MKKKSSIVKLSIIGVLIIVGLVLSFCSFNVRYSTFDSFAKSIQLNLELQGGIYAVYETDTEAAGFDSNKMDDAKDGLFKLLSSKGYKDSLITKEGEDKLRVELPELSDTSSLLGLIGKPAALRIVVQSSQEMIINSKHVTNASSGYYDGSYIVSIELNRAGSRILNDNSDKTLEVITTIDGADTTQNTNLLNGVLYISGLTSSADASNLATQIMSGTLSVPLSLKETSTFSPSIGEDVPLYALIGAICALVLLLAFVGYKYRLLGAIIASNVVIYGILILGFMAVFPWLQLSLAGIAAVLLGLAIILDGNIIVFNRLKEEYKNGKSIISSTHYGFRKSIRTIVDANLMVLLVAIVFLLFPTGSIRALGFALIATTILSLLISLFVARKLTKYFFAIWGQNPDRFALARGEAYAGLGADETAGDVQKQIDAELAEKARIAMEKEDVDVQDDVTGGAQDENN